MKAKQHLHRSDGLKARLPVFASRFSPSQKSSKIVQAGALPLMARLSPDRLAFFFSLSRAATMICE